MSKAIPESVRLHQAAIRDQTKDRINDDLRRSLSRYEWYRKADVMYDSATHEYHISLVFSISEEEAAKL